MAGKTHNSISREMANETAVQTSKAVLGKCLKESICILDGKLSLILSKKLKVHNNAYKMIPLLFKNISTVGKRKDVIKHLIVASLRREPVRVNEQLNFTHFCIMCLFLTSGARLFLYKLHKFVILTSTV